MAENVRKYKEGAVSMSHIDEIFKMGMEAAFADMDPKRFKAVDKAEEKAFLEGYKKGLEIQKENKKDVKSLAA